jgi:amino acid transporter
VALGAALLVVVSAGPIAAELGIGSLLVWGVTVLVGALQCLMLVDLGRRFPDRAGGTATYAAELFQGRWRMFGGLSSWAYWFAWTPGIAVNVLLAAQYLRSTVLPDVNHYLLAGILAVLLYTLSALGMRVSLRSALVLALCALIPLLALSVAPLLRPDLVQTTALSTPPATAFDWPLLLKWMFVAAWSSYGAEMASTVIAELRQPEQDTSRSLSIAAIITVLAYTLIPLALILLVPIELLASDPALALLPAATAVFGAQGALGLSLMLVAALLLGAHAFIVGSSRTLYQMSRDGLIIRQCAKLNRFGVPVGSMVFDAGVTLALLAIFQSRLIEVVAAANVGYLVVFVLLPIVWLAFRQPGQRRWFVPIAVALGGFNLILLLVGGAQWGWQVMLTGLVGTLAFLPLAWWRHVQERR